MILLGLGSHIHRLTVEDEFKADTSFLRFLSMGAVGVHRTMDRFRDRGFEPIELERYCGSNKIWTTKVKRLRLPDLLCVKTGMRAEVRAKTDLKIRMSDAPANPDRVWDAGLRDDDIVAVITCFDRDEGPEPADDAVYFTVGALRASVDRSKLGPPKSASEGAERDRTWSATVPTRDGTVLEVTDERLIVQMNADAERPARRQTYTLHGKSVYVSPGDTFRAQTTILAGEPPELADLSAYLPRRYDDRPELRMEAVFILIELGHSPFSREQLNRVVADPRFEGDELRQAAVWALGKSGLKCYEDVLPFIDDADENLALHAIGAFGADTPRPVIDRLVQDLIAGDPRRAPAASEALRVIGSDEALQALVTVANARQPIPDWIVATLGRLPPVRVRAALQDSPLLDQIAPMLLTAQGAHWLASETIGTDIAFLLKQNLS